MNEHKAYKQLFPPNIVIYIFIILFAYPTQACTAFCLKKDNHLLLAKNLDWPINNGIIILNKKGLRKTAYTDQKPKISWIAKYGSITFNQFGKEFPLGGMNETGLVIEELNSRGQPPNNKNLFKLNEFQFVQYILDNCATVDEILRLQDSITIQPVFINLHYLISDRLGNFAIIEFYDNQSHFYFGDMIKYPILSNNLYKNSLKYISQFKGFGGDLVLKNENTSGERFVRVAKLLKKSENFAYQRPYMTAFSILDSVHQEDTQWSIIYDINEKQIYFKTSLNLIIKSIRLDNFDFSCQTPLLSLNINSIDSNEVKPRFNNFTNEQNTELLMNVFAKYKLYQLGNEEKSVFEGMARYGNSIKCK